MLTVVQEHAKQAYECFECATRTDGTSFIKLKDVRPEWLYEAVRDTHDGMLPDDRIYLLCQDACEAVGDGADCDDFAQGAVDSYTRELLAWATSNLSRVALSEDVARDFGVASHDIAAILSAGQYAEAERVYNGMLAALEEQAL